MNNKSDIRVGEAVIPFDAKQRCWFLPSGKKQTDRRVYKREIAVVFCRRLTQLIGGGS